MMTKKISFFIICYFVELYGMNWTIFRSIWFFYNCSRDRGMANLRTFWKSNIFGQILRILQGIILGWNWRETFWLWISGCTLLEQDGSHFGLSGWCYSLERYRSFNFALPFLKFKYSDFWEGKKNILSKDMTGQSTKQPYFCIWMVGSVPLIKEVQVVNSIWTSLQLVYDRNHLFGLGPIPKPKLNIWP